MVLHHSNFHSTCHAMGAPILTNTDLRYIYHSHSPTTCSTLTEYLALTGIFRNDVDHVLCLHHLQQIQEEQREKAAQTESCKISHSRDTVQQSDFQRSETETEG